MRYFIVGYPKMYDMQYGIYDYRITNVSSFKVAKDIGAQLSREVINEFCRPSEEWYTTENYLQDAGLDFWSDEYDEAYNAALDRMIDDEIAYKIWEVKPEVSDETIRLWANSNDDVNEFVERYCMKDGEW